VYDKLYILSIYSLDIISSSSTISSPASSEQSFKVILASQVPLRFLAVSFVELQPQKLKSIIKMSVVAANLFIKPPQKLLI